MDAPGKREIYRRSLSIGRFVVLLMVVLVTFGCSATRSFKAQKRLNLSPFAEYTIALAADIEYGLASKQFVYLTPYRNIPEAVEYKETWRHIRRLIKGVVVYSVEVVTLGNSTLDGPGRCDALAVFLERMITPIFLIPQVELYLTPAQFDTILADVRLQKKLLDGLNSAQPLVDEFSRIFDLAFERAKDQQSVVKDAVEAAIYEEHKEIIQYSKVIKEEQARHLRSGLMVINYRKGDKTVLAALWENDPQLKQYVHSLERPTIKEFLAIEERLLLKMKIVRDIKGQIAPDLEQFRNEQHELDSLMKFLSLHLGKAKVTMVVWAKTHRKLATGVIDPAKIDVFNMTKKVIDRAL